MKKLIFTTIVLCSMMVSGCSKLGVHYFTAATETGIVYEYEVIVPLMNYVRILPLATPSQLTGNVTIPTTVQYEDTYYIVSQIGSHAFENYSGITQITLPSTVTTIEDNAFRNCTGLSEINTPRPLSTIGNYAFANCSSLREFNFIASISTLGEGCFENCSSLSDLTLPTSLNNIPNRAFYGCRSIRSIYIDRTVLLIGAEAFAECTGVAEMTCMAGMPPTAFDNSFNGINSNIPITVPMGGLDFYVTATGWCNFTNYSGVYK